MNHKDDWQHGGCGRLAERLLLNRMLISGVLVVLSSAPSQGSDGKPSDVVGQRGGLNQSLSLEQEVAVPYLGATDRPTEPPPGQVQAPVDAESRESDESKPAAELRTFIRRPAGKAHSMESPGASTPWYRTGIGALAIVLGIVTGLFFLVRRWVPSGRMADNGILRVVGRTPLTPKQHIALVKVGRRFVAVGVSADRVETLCEISDPDEVADLTARSGSQAARAGSSFDEWLYREAAEYPEPSELTLDGRASTETVVSRSRKPLKELLHSLRKMKMQ